MRRTQIVRWDPPPMLWVLPPEDQFDPVRHQGCRGQTPTNIHRSSTKRRLVLDSREDNIAGLVEHRQHRCGHPTIRSITDTESDTWFTTQASRLSGRTRTETGSSPTETASSHTGGVVAEKISSVAWATLQTSTSPSSVSVTEWTGADSQFEMDR